LASPKQERVVRAMLPDVSDLAERRRIALDHQRKCLARAKQFFEALDQPTKLPESLDLRLIAGDAIPTAGGVRVARDGLIRLTRPEAGDGTVTRASALLDERPRERLVGGVTAHHGNLTTQTSPRVVSPIAWRSVTFLFTDHLRLTSNPAFTDNVLYALLEEPRPAAAGRESVRESSR
jgi:hypothetical protein